MDRLDYFTTSRLKAKHQSRFTRGVTVFNRWRISSFERGALLSIELKVDTWGWVHAYPSSASMLSGNLFKSTDVQVWETRPLFSYGTQFRQIVLDENSIPFKWRWKTWQQTRRFPLQTQPKSFYQQEGQHLLMHASLIGKMCRQTGR